MCHFYYIKKYLFDVHKELSLLRASKKCYSFTIKTWSINLIYKGQELR